jgi:hypothetical protein
LTTAGDGLDWPAGPCRPKIAKREYYLPFVCSSIRLSVRMEQFSSTGWIFHETLRLSIFLQILKKIKFVLKPDQRNSYFE